MHAVLHMTASALVLPGAASKQPLYLLTTPQTLKHHPNIIIQAPGKPPINTETPHTSSANRTRPDVLPALLGLFVTPEPLPGEAPPPTPPTPGDAAP